MSIHSLLLAASTAVLVLGCSGNPDQPAQQAVEQSPPTPASAAGDTIGGDGSDITLASLTPPDIESAQLAGELACGFVTAREGMMLLASGDVASTEPSRGVLKVGDYVETVAAPGGYDAMLDGVAFTGKGKTVTIAVTGPATGGGESPPRPATLTYERADGASRVFDGQWKCGP